MSQKLERDDAYAHGWEDGWEACRLYMLGRIEMPDVPTEEP